MIFIILLLVYSLEDDRCELQLCSITKRDNLLGEFDISLEQLGYTFWYRYQAMVAGDFDFLIFQESTPDPNQIKFSFQISIKNQIARHDFIYKNMTVWDHQLITPVSQDQNYWHFFMMYYTSDQFQIKIIASQSKHIGINIQPLMSKKLTINHNLFYPQVSLTICAEQKEFIQILQQLEYAQIQQCKDMIRQDILLEYSPDFSNFLSQEFNSRNAIISVWMRDITKISNFKFTLLSAFVDLTQGMLQGTIIFNLSDIQQDHFNLTILTMTKLNYQFLLKNSDDEQSLLTVLSNEELSKWYYLKLEPNRSLEVQTINNIYTINSSLKLNFPNTQLQIQVNNTIFSEIQITKSPQQNCPPNCLKCSHPFTCLQCRGNRIFPSCDCPSETFDFGGDHCEYIHIKLQLDQVDSQNPACDVGYQQCGEIIMCSKGYAKYQNKCHKCPQLGDEICQQCLVSPEINERFICKYLSDENLKRFILGEVDITMFFLQQDVYDSQPYQILKLASISIVYQCFDQYGFKAVQYIYQPTTNQTTKKLQCPYRYNFVFNFQDRKSHFCLKIPRNCLRLEYFESYDYQTCQLCQPEYSLIENQCIKCPQKCQSCTISQCTSCIDGYYLSYDGICKQCQISSCKICYEHAKGYLSIQDNMIPYSLNSEPNIYCAICNKGYEFNYQTRKCQLSASICDIAIYNQKSICLVGPDSQLITSSCLQQNCDLCFKNSCIKCAVGHYFEDSKCKECRFQYSFNSDQTYLLDCQLHDPINYSEYKQSLQHIYLLHQNILHSESLTQILLNKCLNSEVLYDIAKCQPHDNVHRQQSGLCSSYLLSNDIRYCIQVNQNLDGIVIDRFTGKAKYCNKYQVCDIKKQYNITLSILGQIQYKDMIFHNLFQFIKSLDIKLMQEHSISEIDLHLTLKTEKLQDIIVRSEISLNLYIYQDRKVSLYLLTRYSLLLTIGYFKLIYFDKMDDFDQSMIFHCGTLHIQRYYLIAIQIHKQEYQRINYIKADSLMIDELFLMRTNTIAQIRSQKSMRVIIQLFSILYSSFDENTYNLFQLGQNHTVFIKITEFRILNSSSISTRLFGDHFQVVDIYVQQFIIQRYEMHNSTILIARNITIDSIVIYNSIFYNSTLFHSNIINIGSLKIINCSFIGSGLIHNKNLLTYQFSQYVILLIEINKIISNRSQLIDFYGEIFISNQIIIANLSIQEHCWEKGFISVNSKYCKIHELGVFDTSLNYMTLLNVFSEDIMLNNISISKSKTSFATLNDRQLIVPQDSLASYIILYNFISLKLTNVYIGQFYVIYPTIKIYSVQSVDILLESIIFDQLQVFTSKIIEISVNDINISKMSFKNIWFHNLNQESSQQDLLFECIGQNLLIYELSFWYIKNTNSHNLQWTHLQGRTVTMNKVLLQQFQFQITKYFQEGSNQTIIDQISNQKGQNQVFNIIIEYLSLDKLIIYAIESSNQYLIRIYSQTVIEKLEIHNTKIQINILAQYRGVIQSNQYINYVNVSNFTCKYLKTDDAIFFLKVNKLLIFNNMSLNINSGGLLNCQSINFSNITLQNIDIDQSLNTLNTPQTGRVLIVIYGGIVRMENFVVKHCKTDVFHLKNIQQVKVNFVYITDAQAVGNLILIDSQVCTKFLFANIFISNHQLYPQDTQIYSATNLITLQLNSVYQYRIINIVFNKNKDISALILIIDSNNFEISNFQIMNNICQQVCLISGKQQSQIQSRRILEQTQFSSLNLIDGFIIGNAGILIDFALSQVQLQQLLIVHNGMIFNLITSNQMVESIEDSQLLYHSDHIIDLTSMRLNNSFVMNEQFQQIHSINTIVLTLSFDGGITQYLTLNHTVVFYKNEKKVKNYCYFPSGQSLGEYQRLNIKNYNYETFIKEMKFGLRGRSSQSNPSCVITYQDKQQQFQMNQQNWKDFTLIAEPQSFVQFQVQCTKYTLQFLVKVLNCQLGEIYLNSSCLRCDSNRNQYSVQRNSIQCLTKTDRIEKVQSGVIKLKPGYWRPFLTNSQIEQCPKQQVCLGGWQVGDNSCLPGYIGALCSVCDIYSQRGYGNYVQNSWNQCELCRTRYSIFLYICIILIIQIVLLYLNNKSWENDCLQLRNTILLVKHYRILVKYYVDHTQVTIKLFTNFLQQFLVITSTCQLGLPVFLKQVFYQYSNPSISIWQEVQCFYANQVSLAFIIQAKPLIIIIVSVMVFNIYLFIHLILIKSKIFTYLFRNLCVTFYYLIIFNYTNYYEILISLTSWRKLSGLRWVNTNLSINYDKQEYIQNLFMFVLPQIAIFWIIPLIILKILKIKQVSLLQMKTYYYWGFLYKQFKLDSYNEEIFLTWIKLIIISISYQLSNTTLYRLSALLLVIVFYKRFQENHTPYQFQNFNRLNLNLYYGLIALVVLFAMLTEQSENQINEVTIIIYFIICLTLLIVLQLILKQLLGSIQHTYKNQIDDLKLIVSKRLPNLQNKFPTLFKSSSIRLTGVKANFDKMRPKNLQLSRSRSLPKQSQVQTASRSKNITQMESPGLGDYPLLQLNMAVKLETSINL